MWSGQPVWSLCFGAGWMLFTFFFVVFSALDRGRIPFISDFKSALANMENWGGGLEFLLWMGLAVQTSLVVSSILLCLGGGCPEFIWPAFNCLFVLSL